MRLAEMGQGPAASNVANRMANHVANIATFKMMKRSAHDPPDVLIVVDRMAINDVVHRVTINDVVRRVAINDVVRRVAINDTPDAMVNDVLAPVMGNSMMRQEMMRFC